MIMYNVRYFILLSLVPLLLNGCTFIPKLNKTTQSHRYPDGHGYDSATELQIINCSLIFNLPPTLLK